MDVEELAQSCADVEAARVWATGYVEARKIMAEAKPKIPQPEIANILEIRFAPSWVVIEDDD